MAALKELTYYRWGNDADLMRLGFQRWEEETTDCDRALHFYRGLNRCDSVSRAFGEDADWEFRLCVKYTIYISDAPDVPTPENFEYSFEGVFVQVFDRENSRRVAECRTEIATVKELLAFVANFTTR